jgi:hypothetical protein
MEIIIWGKHIIHSFIVNLYKAYSYKLLILFKDVLDNSRNYSSVFRFWNVLRDTLWCNSQFRSIFTILAIFYYDVSGYGIKPVFEINFDFFVLNFQGILRSMSTKHSECLSRSCLPVAQYCAVESISEIWYYRSNNFVINFSLGRFMEKKIIFSLEVMM